jgi:hypothetical protein
MRCDYIAEGVIKATKELEMKIPLVVRLKGTKEAEAKQSVSSAAIGENKLNAFLQDDQGLWDEDCCFRWARRGGGEGGATRDSVITQSCACGIYCSPGTA